MKKLSTFLAVVLMIVSIMSVSNMTLFADSFDNGLTADENAAFITREEFEQWRDAFVASLSELDLKSTNKIYDNMNFYDMQFRFTPKYTTDDTNHIYTDESGKPTELLQEMIMEERAKRGLL